MKGRVGLVLPAVALALLVAVTVLAVPVYSRPITGYLLTLSYYAPARDGTPEGYHAVVLVGERGEPYVELLRQKTDEDPRVRLAPDGRAFVYRHGVGGKSDDGKTGVRTATLTRYDLLTGSRRDLLPRAGLGGYMWDGEDVVATLYSWYSDPRYPNQAFPAFDRIVRIPPVGAAESLVTTSPENRKGVSGELVPVHSDADALYFLKMRDNPYGLRGVWRLDKRSLELTRGADVTAGDAGVVLPVSGATGAGAVVTRDGLLPLATSDRWERARQRWWPKEWDDSLRNRWVVGEVTSDVVLTSVVEGSAKGAITSTETVMVGPSIVESWRPYSVVWNVGGRTVVETLAPAPVDDADTEGDQFVSRYPPPGFPERVGELWRRFVRTGSVMSRDGERYLQVRWADEPDAPAGTDGWWLCEIDAAGVHKLVPVDALEDQYWYADEEGTVLYIEDGGGRRRLVRYDRTSSRPSEVTSWSGPQEEDGFVFMDSTPCVTYSGRVTLPRWAWAVLRRR